METKLRLSGPGLKVLKVLLEQPQKGLSGAEISRLAKVGSGTIYPLLARWESNGLASSEWEAVDPSVVGRPRRRFYKLTGLGQTVARDAMAELQVSWEALAWT
jgi:PadR family transcriptional regulator, regulatory protein PadR